VNTDRWYYQVFKGVPDLIRALLPGEAEIPAGLGLDASEPGDRLYRFAALELKELSHRLDGVLWPRQSTGWGETGSPEMPVVLLEVQMHSDAGFHHRLAAQTYRFLQQHPAVRHWAVVVITPHQRLRLGPRQALQVFLAAWAPTDRQRQMLAANRGTGITRVWCHAPGIGRPDGFSLDGISEMTSFCVEQTKLDTAVATPTKEGRAAGLTEAWGPATGINPLFYVVPERGDVVWATFSDGTAAVVVRRSRFGTDVFVAVPALTPCLLRALARHAGVHLYTDVDAAVWAHGNFLCVHTMSDGPLTVTVRGTGPVADVFSGQRFGDGPTATIPMRKGKTLLLRSPASTD